MTIHKVKMTKILSLCFAGLLAVILTSCGASERATRPDPRQPNPTPNGRSLPYGDSTRSEPNRNPGTPPATVLISPADTDAEAVELIEKGRASWYGPKFHGRLTANGEEFDMNLMTAAHRTLPFNTLVWVRNLDNGKTAMVRINDRGPFVNNRILDLSRRAAQKLGVVGPGTANVELYVPKESVDPSRKTNLAVPTYTVQLGSFQTEAQAFTHSSKIQGSRVEVIRKDDDTIYRVYYGLYIDKNAARKKQRELQRKNFSGFVKQIENG